ncbi:spore germination protein KC [Clostridium polyendosporum]|uniref:Spore germination protein KC n=1 Tax=Clostridium polyendosporum TaxID=69208 RepID=A0A919RXQ8_9CLOT|nr:Ger(x)C family spore germination protein [Clostridium polyendosporum]GIM28222.1 spore germination protein KC [Clostridium polyendosporum]
MYKKIFCIMLINIFFFSLMGCWGKREINENFQAIGIGIDKKEDHYLITYQIINPEEVSGKEKTGTTPVITVEAEGASISEASRRLTLKVSKKVNIPHLRVLVLGESFAREGIKDALDFFIRNRDARSNFYIVVAKGGTASDVLKVFTPLQKIPAEKIHDSLETAQEFWSPATTIRKYELLSDVGAEAKDPILTGILVKGKKDVGMTRRNVETIEQEAYIEVGTIGVFKGDKLVGWLDENESSITNSILRKVKNTIRVYSYVGYPISLEIQKLRSKIKVVNDKGKPKIIYYEDIVGDIAEVTDDIKIKDPQVIKKFEKYVEEFIKLRAENAIKRVQQDFHADIFGFGLEISRQHPKLWEKVKDNWDKEFAKLPVEVIVTVRVNDTGVIIDPIEIK